MEAAPAASQFLEFLVTLLTIGLPGLPPGERDPNLWHAIPADAVVAFEWSAQGKGGPAAGLDGFAAEPEVQALWAELRRAAADATPSQPPGDIYHIPREAVARVLLSRPGCVYLALAPQESGLPPLQRLRVALVVNAGHDSQAFVKQLAPLLPDWMLRDTRANPSFSALVTGLVQFRQAGPYVVWGMNAGAADEALARLTENQGGLAATPEFTRRFEEAAIARPASVLWVHGSSAVDGLLELIPAAAALKEHFPISTSSGCLVVTGVEQGHVVTRGNFGRQPGSVATLSRDSLRHIPADAQLVLCGTVDLDINLLERLAAFVPDGPASQRQMREALRSETDHDLDAEVFAAFGQRWTVYSAPSTGGPLGVGPILALELKQPMLVSTYFPGVMSRWQRRLDEDANGHVLRKQTVHGVELYSLQTPAQSAKGLVPSWCVTEQHLLLAPQPQLLRAHLRFLGSQQPRFAERVGKDVSFPEGSVAWGFIDSPALTSAVWPLLPYLAGRLDPQLNVSIIPSLGAIRPHIGVTTVSAQADANSWRFECRNPLSLAAPLVAGAFLYEAATNPRERRPTEGTGVELGAAEGETEGVKPAVAVEEQAEPSPARRMLPGFLRAVTPDDVESLIPADVFRRLEQGPTPEEMQQREERRRARQERRNQRKGVTP